MTSENKKTLYLIGGLLVAVVILIAVGRLPGDDSVGADGKKTDNLSSGAAHVVQNGRLGSEETSFDFGRISMSKGEVEHIFRLKNNSSGTATITKMYTSCMCTTAYLSYLDFEFGPVGMPGHLSIPSMNKEIVPGGMLDVRVVFNPAAHGPAGVGRIERVVTLEEAGGSVAQVGFTATVTP